MKNFIQNGDVLDLTAPYDVASGAGFLIGSLFAVAVTAAASGAPVEGKTNGVYDLKYTVAAAAAVGDTVYWDDTAKNVTKTASTNKKIGVCAKAAASGDATMRVKLIPTI